MLIKYINIRGFRGILNEISLHPARLNILVGRNNVGKSSILDAVSLVGSSLCDYEDVLGKNIIEGILLGKKKIKPEHLINVQERSANIAMLLSNGHVTSLSIRLYNNLSELIHDDEFAYECLIRWIEGKIRKLVDKLVALLAKEVARQVMYHEPVTVGKLLSELEDLKRAIIKKEPPGLMITRIDKLISLIEREGKIAELYEKMESDLKPRLFDVLYEDFQKKLHEIKFVLFKLMIDDEVARIDWTPLKPISCNGVKISTMMRKIITSRELTSLLRMSPLRHMIVIRFTPTSLYTLYKSKVLREQKYKAMKVLYLTHRGMWEFEDLEYMFSEVFKRGLKAEVLEKLGDIQYYERFRDLSIIKENGEHKLMFLTEYGPLPLAALGDGYLSLLRLVFIHTLAGREGVLLMEEPETSLHPGYMALYSRICLSFIRELGQQIFMSTHSLELIRYLLMEAEEYDMLEDIKIFHLKKEDNRNCVREYGGVEALRELEELYEDLRGI
ncbi:MAG: hypothetical protein DRN15_11370 [Thermoprotei archaeon]|nr:MAG: hypothetical protein DRN15_11370 [Thermoprotei archaeon]